MAHSLPPMSVTNCQRRLAAIQAGLMAICKFSVLRLHILLYCARIIRSLLHFHKEVFPLQKHIVNRVRILHWCTDQIMTDALAQMDLTASQGHIMGYLCRQSDPPCARDIEQFFKLSHPTVSGLLTRLERKGFIEFRPDENDRRCKRIFVLPKGEEGHQRIIDIIQANEARMLEGFSDEEWQQFSAFLDRAIQNVGACACKSKPKEEPKE